MPKITQELKDLYLLIANDQPLYAAIHAPKDITVTQATNKPNQKIINHLKNNNDIIDQYTFDEIIKVLSAFNTWQKSYLQDFAQNFEQSAEEFKKANNPTQQAHIKYSPSSIESAYYYDKTLGGIKLFQQLGAKNIFEIEALKCIEVSGENKYFAGGENTGRIKANLQKMSKLDHEIIILQKQHQEVIMQTKQGDLIINTKNYISKHNIDVNLPHYASFKDAQNNPNHFLHNTIQLIELYAECVESGNVGCVAMNFEVPARTAFPALENEQIAKIKILLDELNSKGKLDAWHEEPGIFEIICNFFAQIFCTNDATLGYVATVHKAKEVFRSDLSSSLLSI
jgi:hypothetical protein